MIKSYNTAAAASTAAGESGKGSNVLAWVVGIGIAAFLGYQFIYKPWAEKKKAEAEKKS